MCVKTLSIQFSYSKRRINTSQYENHPISNYTSDLYYDVGQWIIWKKVKYFSSKRLSKFQKPKENLKAISATQTAAAIIEEIGTQDHQNEWNFGYYDR